VLAALAEADRPAPTVIGGRYGLGSKEFTPGMVAGIFAELARERPRPRFTVGIVDDVTGLSLPYDEIDIEPPDTVRALFYGLGSDGTVGANKNTVKILGAGSGRHAQGYFVYDSKKSGSMTVSHLRFGPAPIRAPYLIARAGFVGCHHLPLLDRSDALARAADHGTLLLNCPRPDQVWDELSREAQEQIIAKQLTLYAVDADRIAAGAGLPGRTNTVLQTCFFAISGVLPRDEAVSKIKQSIEKTYRNRGAEVVARNHAAVDAALDGLRRIAVPARASATRHRPPPVPPGAPPFVRRVTGPMLAGERATGCRSARCRPTAPTRAAPPRTRSATSPTWWRSGTPGPASSAARAASSARTASSGPSTTTSRSWRAPRTSSRQRR
jgi:pyruvate-ferredoxin/flavodoxin oxidoreductase